MSFEWNTKVDYAEVRKSIAESNPNDINIEQFFTEEELANISEYEKKRLRNMKQNYDMLIKFGLPAKKPDFMVRKYKRKKKPEPDSDEGEDLEWTPALEKSRGQSDKGRKKWVPPKMPKSRTQSAASGKKNVTFHTSTKPASISRPVKPPEPFFGFDEEELEESDKVIQKRIDRLGRIIGKLESEEMDPVEAQLLEPTDFYSKRQIKAMVKKVEAIRQPKPCKRYPRRSVPKKDYSELEVPDEDHFLYCDDCEAEHLGDCPVHGPLTIVEDTKVTAEELAKSGSDKAHMTLPGTIEIKKSKIPRAGDGAWTKTDVPKGVRFGPYEGKILKSGDAAQVSGYCWQIHRPGKDDYYIDADSKAESNWMRYVNCARVESEQNLIAFQYHGQIYYRTILDIPEGTELLVWYGDEYGAELGIEKENFYQDGTQNAASAMNQTKTRPPHTAFLKPFPVKNKTRQSFKKPIQPDPTGTFQCGVCKEKFATQRDVQKHVCSAADQCGEVRGKQCCFCGKMLGSVHSVKQHVMIHTGEKPYQCDICQRRFTESGHLVKHKRTHTGEKPYQCDICQARFTVSCALITHKRTHTGEKPFQCDICQVRCSQSSDLIKHKRTHTGEKPFQCDICQARFSDSSYLIRHKRTHSGEKPYQCDICQTRCLQSSDLIKHKRIHTGEKPFQCDICPARFTQSGPLITHKRTHTGEKPFQCDICQARFTQSSNMRAHMKTHARRSNKK